MRLWRNSDGVRKSKYLVTRRDGSTPEWPYFVIGARDPAAPDALIAYSSKAMELGMDPAYCDDLVALAAEFVRYRAEHGSGDPDAAPHRADDPATIEKMAQAKGA